MLIYCSVCKKKTENKDAKVIKTKNNRLMLTLKCVIIKSQDLLKNKMPKDY